MRDPRKRKAAMSVIAKQHEEASQIANHNQHPPPPAFAPNESNQQSIGSSLGSYALAGAGMALGFTLVRVVFGV